MNVKMLRNGLAAYYASGFWFYFWFYLCHVIFEGIEILAINYEYLIAYVNECKGFILNWSKRFSSQSL